MAYEYEKENIRKLKSYNVLSGGTNITKPIDELQEVYQKARLLDDIVITTKKRLSEQERKAQAFDRIKVIHSDYSIGDAKCIEMIGNELERADDER